MKNTSRSRVFALRHRITFSEADLTFPATDGYDRIAIRGGTQTAQVGWPSLPVVCKRFVLPANAAGIQVQASKAAWKRLPGRYTLAPVQPLRPAGTRGVRPASPARLVRRSGRLPLPPVPTDDPGHRFNDMWVNMLPEVKKMPMVQLPLAELASVSHLGGRTVVAVRLHPLRYAPRRHRAELLTSIDLQIDYTLGRRRATAKRLSPSAAGEDLKRLVALVENPQDIALSLGGMRTFDDLPPICPETPGLDFTPKLEAPVKVWPHLVEGAVLFPPDVVLYPFHQEWPYLIITDNYTWSENGTKGAYVGELIAEFERLARWKTMKGVRGRVVSISNIMANAYGNHWQPGVTRDVQEAIRNFLKYAHVYWNTRWCLLGGDVNILPPRHILGNSSWYYIEKKSAASPAAGKMYHDTVASLIRYHAEYDFTKEDLFFAVETAQVICHDQNASTQQPGWYWTQSDYTTKSTTATRFIVLRGPASLLGKTFTVPQYRNMIPADFYYGSVSSPLYSQPGRHDWDNDDNGIYGWYESGNPDGVDFAADISIGRAPVNDTASAKVFVDKVLTYELYQDVRTDQPLSADFARKLMAVGAVWGSNWWDGSFEHPRWASMDGACQDKENVIAQFRTNGIGADKIQRVYEDIFFVPRIESNLFALDQAHIAKMRALVNDGPHFMSVSGHGNWDGCSGISSTSASYVNVDGMSNWPNLAIYFVDSCLTNEFDLTHWTAYNRTGGTQAGNPNWVCLGKHLLQHAAGGAIGYVGYSRSGGVGVTHELPFWDALSLYGQEHLGRMLDHARELCKDRWPWQAYIMTLMGDPELHVWTQPPRTLTVSHTSFIYGLDRLTVSVYHKEQPLTNITVTVCQMPADNPNHKVYFDLVEATAGHYTFDTRSAADGDVLITVTGKNYIPYLGKATKVSNPVSPWKYRTDGFVYDIVSGSGSSIFAASGDQALYAFSPTTNLMWSRSLGGPVQDLDGASDGSVLVGLRKLINGNLRIYSSNGTQLHSWNLPREIYCTARDAAHVAAYAGMQDDGIRAYHTGTGALLWSRNDVGSCLHLGVDAAGNVYASVTSPKPTILKLSQSTGATLWSYQIGDGYKFESRAFLVEGSGVCYVGTRNHELHKISSSGNLAWKLSGGNGANELGSAVHSLIKSGTRLYAGAGDGSVLAIAQDGSVLWRYDIGDRTDCMALGAALYLGSWHGVTALDTDGTPLWFREVTGGVLSMLRKSGRLYAGSRDGWVYQIDVPFGVAAVGELAVKGDVVKYQGVLVSAGGTRILPLAELEKLLRVIPEPGPGPIPEPDPGPLPRPG